MYVRLRGLKPHACRAEKHRERFGPADKHSVFCIRGCPVAQMTESLPVMTRPGFDPWVGKIPWGRKGNPLQYSCLQNPMGRGAWWATAHGVAESGTTERLTLAISWTKHKTATYKTQQLQFFSARACHTVSYSNTVDTWCEELTPWNRPWCWGRLKPGGEGDDRGDGWMASPIQWTWVWVDSGSWW